MIPQKEIERELLKEIEFVISLDIKKVDAFYLEIPSLSDMEITKAHPYFEENNISLPAMPLSSEDLKTISYLAMFHKERVAYTLNAIDSYLSAIGEVDPNSETFSIRCYENDTSYISMDYWKGLNETLKRNYLTSNIIKMLNKEEIAKRDLTPHLANHTFI